MITNHASTDALTDNIILSKAYAQQIERHNNRIRKAVSMMAVSRPVLFDVAFTGIMGEKISLQGVPFDQLSEPLQEMLHKELISFVHISSVTIKLNAVRRLAEVNAEIALLRNTVTASDQ